MTVPPPPVTPLRIIHVASGREWRGGQRQAWLLARALARLGVPQIVVTGRGTALADHLVADQIPVHLVDWRAGLSPAAAHAAWLLAANPGLLHAHDGHATTLAGMAAAMRNRPFITTRRVVFPLRRQGFWKRADRVVAISGAIRDVLVQDGIPPDRVPVIPSGIDLDSLSHVSAIGARAAHGLPEHAPLAIAVGQLEPSKDHQTLIAAAAHLHARHPDLHWAIAGRGPLERSLREAIRTHGLAERVHLLGQLDDPLPLMAAADLFVTSSANEGLGTAMLDAMALGRPIVATGSGGIPEVLTEGAGLVVPVGDAPALGDAVSRVLTEEPLRHTLGSLARRRADAYSADRMAAAYLALYRTVWQERT